MILCLSVLMQNSAQAQNWLPVKIESHKDQLKTEVFVAGELFTAYIWPETLKKPVLWPVVAPGGQTITRSFPLAVKAGERADHPHHVGIWLNFGDVNGLDFWNNSEAISIENAARYGTIRHESIERAESGSDRGELVTTAFWEGPGGSRLLHEKTSYTFRATTSVRIIDRVTTLKAVNGDVLFRDNKEGMFAIRVTTELELPAEGAVELTDAQGIVTRVEKPDLSKVTGDYLSSEGLTGDAVWGTRATWMRLTGKMNGEDVSVVILDHPGNQGYPTYWHARGYGLFSANTLGQKPLSGGRDELNFSLKNGESVTFRYRLMIFRGTPDAGTLNKLAEEWGRSE
jgi:hypothetical protein